MKSPKSRAKRSPRSSLRRSSGRRSSKRSSKRSSRRSSNRSSKRSSGRSSGRRTRKSPKKSPTKRSIRRSKVKLTPTQKLCKALLAEKMKINMKEWKAGKLVSQQQAIAVSYAQVRERHPRCKF